MAAITQFQPGSWGGTLHGSFAGKTPFTPPLVVAAITLFQPGSWGGRLHGSFAGKTPFNPTPPVTGSNQQTYFINANIGRMMR